MSETITITIDVADDINQLIRPSHTSEPIRRPILQPNGKWEAQIVRHNVEHPPLLVQLKAAAAGSTAAGEAMMHNTTSKPPARVDAIALLERIRRQSHELVDELGTRRGSSLADRLSGIAGATDVPDDVAREVRKTVHSWVLSARIVTGWDQPPFAPDVSCPNIECERRGSLRIRLADRIAACIECGTTWDNTEVEHLGQYVRWATEHLGGARHWLTDDDGYPTECTECLEAREQMAERRASRARHAEPRSA